MGPVGAYLRQHHLALIALFFALSGSAVALQGRNTVDSGDIKKGQVKSSDVANDTGRGALRGIDIAANSLTGNDVNESSLQLPSTLPPSGPAGGDLSGTYPNPSIAADAITGGNVAGNSLDGSDIDESSLSVIQGNGQVLRTAFDTGAFNGDVITLPGIGRVRFGCDFSALVNFDFLNESGAALRVIEDNGAADPTRYLSLADDTATTATTPKVTDTVTYDISHGGSLNQHATVTVSGQQIDGSIGCAFHATAILGLDGSASAASSAAPSRSAAAGDRGGT